MRTIRLKPLVQPPARCEDYADESTVRRFEQAVRTRRAHVEPYTILAEEARVDGTYQVRGLSGEMYRVDIVDGSGLNDTCTCPDFLTNDLGTCKHIEAVRRALIGSPKLRKAWQVLPAKCRVPTVTVAAAGGLALRHIGSWTNALMSRYPNGGDRFALGGGVLPGRHGDGVRIVHAAVPAFERIRTVKAIARREQRVRTAVETGQVGLEVLSKPLFPYQREGVLHLAARGRALLADDMGLGKTVQAIAACEVMRARGEVKRVLIVTPASLKSQWASEIQRYAGERAVVVGGPAATRRDVLASDAPYFILNYELTWRELSRLQSLEADVLILDEAQRAKNFRTKTAATLRAIPSRFVFVLTGTPIENRLDDLYSLMQLVDPTRFGPLWKFNHAYHVQNEKGRVVGYKNMGALREVIAPVVLRRRKEAVLTQLPPLVEQTRFTAMSKEQAELEGSYRMEASKLIAISERRPLRPEEQELLHKLLLKARQACNALELCDPTYGKTASPKLDEFEALVSEILEQGTSKVLVFSEWVGMLKLARVRLDRLGVGSTMLHGGIPTAKRPALIERFRQEDELRVMLSSDAGGVGLNLQVASYVIHLDLPWNPARLDQRTARAHRIGQTRGVSVVHLCAAEGIENGIRETLSGKRAVRDAALEPDSDVEELPAPSFMVFVKQLRDVLDATATQGQDVEVDDGVDSREAIAMLGAKEAAAELAAEARPPFGDAATIAEAMPLPAVETSAESPVRGATAESSTTSRDESTGVNQVRARRCKRADDRLRLANVVLDAGFAADAVKAAYDALASAITALTEAAKPSDHAALVVLLYKELIPSGRLPSTAPGVLARLHDLTMLQQHGVDVDEQLARQVVGEAEEWVNRLGQQS
jgi:superfamily II DNA or RNA helicase/uncharacterized protein (UPF0332 family)